MLRDILKINTSAVLAVSAAQLLELAWKCLKWCPIIEQSMWYY